MLCEYCFPFIPSLSHRENKTEFIHEFQIQFPALPFGAGWHWASFFFSLGLPIFICIMRECEELSSVAPSSSNILRCWALSPQRNPLKGRSGTWYPFRDQQFCLAGPNPKLRVRLFVLRSPQKGEEQNQASGAWGWAHCLVTNSSSSSCKNNASFGNQ